MRVAIMKADLHIAAAQSLKEKRHVVRSLKDKLFARFNISVTEVGAQDLWQRCELGMAMVCLDSKTADASIRKVEDFIRGHHGATLLGFEREILVEH